MTKIYNPELERALQKAHVPYTVPRFATTSTLTINKHTYHITTHNNGKRDNNVPRKRKVLVYARQGLVPARRFFYHLYHPRWNGEGIIIHLDNNDMNFSKNNLILLTEREANTLVHFNNNNIVHNNPELQSMVIQAIRAGIALQNLNNNMKGGDKNE